MLRRVSRIPDQGRQPAFELLPWSLVDRPGDQHFGRARCWRTSTPYVPPRHAKPNGRDSLREQLRWECEQRRLPAPEVSVMGPWEGYIVQRHGQKRAAGQAQRIALEFPEPVRGPVLLGANSHFGLGRFEPVDG